MTAHAAASVPAQLSEACLEERPADMGAACSPHRKAPKPTGVLWWVQSQASVGKLTGVPVPEAGASGHSSLRESAILPLSLIFKNQKFVICRNLAKNKVLFRAHIATFKMSDVGHFF